MATQLLEKPRLRAVPGQECAYRALQVAREGKHRVVIIGNTEADLLAADAHRLGVVAEAVPPCKCGHYGDSSRECTCTIGEIRDHHRRIRPSVRLADMVIDAPRCAFRSIADKRECNWLKDLDADSIALLEQAYCQLLDLTDLRKVISIAGSVANLAGAERIRLEHVSEAIQYVSTGHHWVK